jgi:hypothetical protein
MKTYYFTLKVGQNTMFYNVKEKSFSYSLTVGGMMVASELEEQEPIAMQVGLLKYNSDNLTTKSL